MTMHYHMGPITPLTALYELAGRHLGVSYHRPDQVRQCFDIAQSVFIDNGAYSVWRIQAEPDWPGYYVFCDRWLDYPTSWAVIPDAIDAGVEANDALLGEWPHGERGAPVWHLDEPIDRLLRLADEWPRICFGSSGQFEVVGSARWHERVCDAFDALAVRHRRLPWVHMLRGMSLSGSRYPFASLDSTDVARNHNRTQNTPAKMAARWDAMQCPARWEPGTVPRQEALFA